MTDADDEELRALRTRAYGRHSDIHLDPDSLERLRELESSLVDVKPEDVDEPSAIIESTAAPTELDADPEPTVPRPTPRWVIWLSGVGRWLLGLRRSTVLIVVGFAALAAAIATVLIAVQRVQTDPLQAGADQVARLSVDHGYDIPSFFTGGAGGSGPGIDVQAFQQFHGLRPVISSASFVSSAPPDDTCLTLYPEANITTTADSFSGPIFAGCEAGDFPAMVQFSVEVDQLPAELQSAFPPSTGLQFVYDRENNEVVVFSDH